MSGEKTEWVKRINRAMEPTVSSNAGRIAAMSTSRTVAEVAATSVSLGTAYVLDHVWHATLPKQALAKVLMAVNAVPFIDKGANILGGLETDEEKAARQAATKEERAQIYADNGFDYGLRLAAGALTQEISQKHMDDLFFEVTPPTSAYRKIAWIDRGVQVGAFALLNTVFSEQNQQMQEKLTPIIQHAVSGLTEDDARKWSRDAINIQIPNLIALGLSVGMMDHEFRKM